MTFNVAMLKQMQSEGLSFDAAIRVLEAGEPKQSPAAVRQKRYRDNKRNVTRDVTSPPNEIDNLTPVEVSEARASSPQPRAWALPAGVNLQVWTDLKKNRAKKRLPNTDTAWKGFLEDLERVSRLTGIPPPQLIEQCTAKGWGGIYDPREQRHGQSTSNVTSLRGSRPDPALDMWRAAVADENEENNLRTGPSLPALGSGGP